MNNFISWQTKKLGEPIEVFPGYFCKNERSFPKVTKDGMEFLRDLCNKYVANEISVPDFLSKLQEVANEFSGWESEVNEKLYNTAMNILSNI